jgi:hypothetical protein
MLAAGALALVESIAAIGTAITGIETLTRYQMLRADGVLSWEVSRLRTNWYATSRVADCLSKVFRYPNALVLYAGRLFLALFVVLGNLNVTPFYPQLVAFSILGLATIHALLAVRCPLGRDGAEQFLGLTFTACWLCRLAGGSNFAAQSTVLFIALQASLSYATAGWLKATTPLWWNGHYLGRILSTRAYGTRSIGEYLVATPAASKHLSRIVIVLEIVFPLALVLPQPFCRALVVAMLGFHVINAFVMGLNNFIWAFGATYPAVLCANEILRNLVKG